MSTNTVCGSFFLSYLLFCSTLHFIPCFICPLRWQVCLLDQTFRLRCRLIQFQCQPFLRVWMHDSNRTWQGWRYPVIVPRCFINTYPGSKKDRAGVTDRDTSDVCVCVLVYRRENHPAGAILMFWRAIWFDMSLPIVGGRFSRSV